MTDRPRRTLAALPVGSATTVAAVDEEQAAHLAREGIAAGVRVTVEAVAPFGGPLIVRVGRARVALGRRVAETIEVAAEPGAVAP
jgi:Fe2+ transport system protein FeoA